MSQGGRWLGDEISVSEEAKIGFTDITRDLILTGNIVEFRMIVNNLDDDFVLDASAFGSF